MHVLLNKFAKLEENNYRIPKVKKYRRWNLDYQNVNVHFSFLSAGLFTESSDGRS